MTSEGDVRARLQRAGQEHLLRFWPELEPGPRAALLAELATLEPEALREHCQRAAAACENPPGPPPDLAERLRPLPPERVGSASRSDPETRRRWEEEGFRQIALNKVAVLLLAGGQGTRLGVAYPKGMYCVGLPSGKTLYQLQAERIRRVEQLAGERRGTRCTVPWYIMTSEFTLGPTAEFFKEHDFFRLDPANVVMFEQRMLPAVTFEGKAILERKDKVAMAPDGNGGLYRALTDHQILEDMERRGVEFVHVYCVDNILVRLADPVFIGFCVLQGADCGAKVVEKAYPEEPVGVVCQVDGVPQVLEYSEVSSETAQLRASDGRLVYHAGNICNHFFTRGFLQMVTRESEPLLKLHVAVKKVPYIDEEGNLIKPLKPNAIKMEKFVFDVFQFAKNFVAFEVLREEEFSPLKNADPANRDSPCTVRQALLAQHYQWALQAGARFLDAHRAQLPELPSFPLNGDPPAICEISPLVSYSGEGFGGCSPGLGLWWSQCLSSLQETEGNVLDYSTRVGPHLSPLDVTTPCCGVQLRGRKTQDLGEWD
ncbi:UDP-N-acetylhexosamine pyrophosphorylase-like protein 1 isoform X1 [Otolemur garnettii]|uniref:UDP-N-acetylhexosamine pyrophosphorylase-like protein 1 isoform X1 n=1 Tax=Otolemur garnettii TaxID=30611 RepID=UPI000C7EF1A4|nr:UDP-N-acetylhexosamine pyrophosphorylase-like protein 1 isoform X1 [Otolemur garnettii]XP_023371901.1 UDP-N-acetylhexosamine pyrophosphorylase-like protein 1 isoform X1 [Otolemur garnettii]